jgi:hypothetical protein
LSLLIGLKNNQSRQNNGNFGIVFVFLKKGHPFIQKK